MDQLYTARLPVRPNQVSQWKRQQLDIASELFTRGKPTKNKEEGLAKEAQLFQQICRLQMELEWLKKCLSCSDARDLRKLVDLGHPELSISRQYALLGLPRPTLYYRPKPVRESTLRIMARIETFICKIPAAVAAGWWAIWPEMKSRTAVTGCETSCGTWVYGRSNRKPAPRFQGIHLHVSPSWWIWRLRWKGGARKRSFTPTKDVSSPHPFSLPGCRLSRFR